jgi:beta-xylosidase
LTQSKRRTIEATINPIVCGSPAPGTPVTAQRTIKISSMFHLIFLLALLTGLWGACPQFAIASSETPIVSTPWLDNFDNVTLNSRWSWVREDHTHWDLTSQPGNLTITTQGDWIWGTDNSNPQHNLFITPAPNGDFKITTKVNFNPITNFQNAGLLIYKDDDNYLKLQRIYAAANVVELIKETAGSPSVVASIPVTSTTVDLRVEKKGTSYYATYSLDGSYWIPVGVTTSDITNFKVGLDASNEVPSVPEIPANFDFFELEAYQIFLPALMRGN